MQVYYLFSNQTNCGTLRLKRWKKNVMIRKEMLLSRRHIQPNLHLKEM